jgi:tRNA pseudouridine-54 N-methylase
MLEDLMAHIEVEEKHNVLKTTSSSIIIIIDHENKVNEATLFLEENFKKKISIGPMIMLTHDIPTTSKSKYIMKHNLGR